MRLKQQIEDFRVRELLVPDALRERGEFRVYRVTKRKLTSLEAASRLAALAGVQGGAVSMAGLKDRQGITTQHMTVRRGKDVTLRERDLRIESVGFLPEEIGSQHSEGNAFQITARALDSERLDTLRANLPAVRGLGTVNYFDEQRFGNLRHNQGWIALMLIRGQHEDALRRLLCSVADHEQGQSRSFKNALDAQWGDWNSCRDIAGRWGAHHSVFEHLKRSHDDFAGAFRHVATRLRLIHLYSYQSHLWNRAVAEFVRRHTPLGERVMLDGVEGPLVYPRRAPEAEARLALAGTFRLPGPRLEDVTDPLQRELLEEVLAEDRLVAADLNIEDVPGFQLKGEDRAILVEPRHLRVRPPEPDPLNSPLRMVRIRFELPRGAYATLVVRRLLG